MFMHYVLSIFRNDIAKRMGRQTKGVKTNILLYWADFSVYSIVKRCPHVSTVGAQTMDGGFHGKEISSTISRIQSIL